MKLSELADSSQTSLASTAFSPIMEIDALQLSFCIDVLAGTVAGGRQSDACRSRDRGLPAIDAEGYCTGAARAAHLAVRSLSGG